MRLINVITNTIASRRRRVGILNKSTLIRWFTERDNYTLKDKSGNGLDAEVLGVVSSVTASSIITFTDLTGVTIVSYSGDQLLSISGNTIVSSGVGEVYSLLLSNGSFYPVLHLKTDVVNGNDIVSFTDLTEGYSLTGSLYMQDNGAVLLNGEYTPNKPDGTRAIEGGELISGSTSRLNATPCKVRLFTLGDTEPAKLFFDKSNTLIYKDSARVLLSYDFANTGDFRETDLTQEWSYEHIQPAYQYQWWIKLKDNGVYSDLFLYPAPLAGKEICIAKDYVNVGEVYSSADADQVVCRIDSTI